MNQQNDNKADSGRIYQRSHEVMNSAHCACVRYEYTVCHEIARIFGISFWNLKAFCFAKHDGERKKYLTKFIFIKVSRTVVEVRDALWEAR
jgi:serine/threonine protein kinase HipA of HipAB toxin-antitoxin module